MQEPNTKGSCQAGCWSSLHATKNQASCWAREKWGTFCGSPQMGEKPHAWRQTHKKIGVAHSIFRRGILRTIAQNERSLGIRQHTQKEWVRARKPVLPDRSYPLQQRRIYRRKNPIPRHLPSMHRSFSSSHPFYHPPDVFLALIPPCSIQTHHHAHSSIACYPPHANLLFSDPATSPLTSRPPCHHQRSTLSNHSTSISPTIFHPIRARSPTLRSTTARNHMLLPPPPHIHRPPLILSTLPPSAGCLPTIHACISFTVMSILISSERCMNFPPPL